MSLALPAQKLVKFAGVPLAGWGFAFRNWAAMMLALYVAFWLQLESASSAAVCVGILALPTRGQVLQKAFYRFAATIIGVAVSIVIAGVFAEVRDLFIVAFAAWLGICVYASGLLDGNRAYGAVLSGYTVAIVAVAEIDSPQDVFSAGIGRGAAILVGVLSIAVVNDVFAAPDIFPGLLDKLEKAHREVRRFVRDALQHGEADAADVAKVLLQITGLHPDITALPGESTIGRIRAAAARVGAIAMVREVAAARAVALTLSSRGRDGDTLRDALVDGLDRENEEATHDLRARLETGMLEETYADRLVAGHAAIVLLEQDHRAADALRDMREGRGPTRLPRLPLFRSHRAAIRSALRAFLTVLIAATALSLAGWPASSFALTLLGATVAISATNPNPRAFASGAVIAMPFAAAAAGITQFLILDGVDQFQLLAIGMAPTIIIASLFLASGVAKLYPIGFLMLVFFPVLLAPANPQAYNPQTYLTNSTLAITAVIALFLVLNILLPTTDALRRRWLLRSACDDVDRATNDRHERLTPPAAAYRDADRIGQFGALKAPDEATKHADLCLMLQRADIAASARRINALLDEAGSADKTDVAAVHGAVATLEPDRLRQTANDLVAKRDSALPRRVAAELAWIATLLGHGSHKAAAPTAEPAR